MNGVLLTLVLLLVSSACVRSESPAVTPATTTRTTTRSSDGELVKPEASPPSLPSLTSPKTVSTTTSPVLAIFRNVSLPRSNKLSPTLFAREEDDSEAVPLVIFSNRHEIRSVDLRTHTARSLISGLKNTIALDFYHARQSGPRNKSSSSSSNSPITTTSSTTTTLRPPALINSPSLSLNDEMRTSFVKRDEDEERDMIFWTDVLDDKIYRGTIVHGSLTNIEVVIESGLATAEGLAVDWIGKNLYWVESNLDQIEVCKLNGSFRRTLIAGNMESPRAIALDPRYGLMFWSDWDSEAPRIESASMSGQNRKAVYFVDKRDGAWPNGLTLDYDAMRIYWLDARSDSIHSVKYDGSDPTDVLRGHELLTHPFAISLYENSVYWTDWRTNSVIRANKYNGSDVRVIQKAMTQPFDVKIYHPSRQPVMLLNGSAVNSPCSDTHVNGGCSHLCLIDLNQEYRCMCPLVMKLDASGKTCVPHEIVLLLSKPNEIRGVDLEQPAFNVIPPISLPKVIQAGEIDFDAVEKRIYWTDHQMNEVKRANLTGNTVDSLIDTVIEHPYGFAIDWISRNMFISSQETSGGSARIYVCNLRGEFILDLITDSLANPRSLAVDPVKGILYWADHGTQDVDDLFVSNSSSPGNSTTTATTTTGKSLPVVREEAYIAAASMDGSNRRNITTFRDNVLLHRPSSLNMDPQSNRLYWVNLGSGTIQFIDLSSGKVTTIWDDNEVSPRIITLQPHAIALHQEKILVASHFTNSTYIMSKNDGNNLKVLKNHTDDVSYLKVYDGSVQSGSETNACSINNGNCEHLCLPTANNTRVCKCAISFSTDPKNSSKCIGPDVFLMYSWNYGIKGLPADPVADKMNGSSSTNASETQVAMLPPISKILLATRIDFSFRDNLIFWLDSDDGTISSIKRDTTGYRTIVHGLESIEGLAVDWIAGNVYWVDPSYDVIEVSRMNGSSRMVIISGDMDKPNSIVVHPMQGYLFWSDAGEVCKIERSRLDGSDRRVILNDTLSQTAITNIAVDLLEDKLYWCDMRSHSIERMDLYGKRREVVVKGSDIIKSPISIMIYGEYIYWADTNYKAGSIVRMDKDLMSNTSAPPITVLTANIGDHVKDVKIFHERPTTRDNPCAVDNGGCFELCLYVGEGVRKCACSHGKLAADGQNCESYDAFIMFSRVLEIDSIHIEDAADLNSPLPIISNKEFMRNVIGLTFDFKNKKVIYSDIQKGSINSVFFNGSDHTVLIEKQGSVEGLVYDQIYSTLYWTSNSESSISRINMRSDSPQSQVPEKIIKLSLDDKPRGIAVDSCASKVYWTNWNTKAPAIQRAYLSGFDIESIITTDIKMPNAITLDHAIQQLFWSDARLDKIERCNLDGTRRHVLLRDTPQHPFDLATYDRFIFWTDWVAHAIYRADKITGGDVLMLRRNVPRPMGIIAVANDTEDCTMNPCLSANSGCAEVCTVNLNSSISCGCNPGRVLLPDGKKCVARKANCSDQEFECTNGVCIPFEMTCDGVSACSDSSDEALELCSRDRSCPANFFKCPNDRCIPSSKICDGIKNCPDSSDEFNCTCGPDKFKCTDGRCIGKIYRCDTDPDCPDASDEMGCPAPDCSVHPLFWDTERRFVNCANTTACIHPDWICDGQNDCWDNSDEKDCPMGNRTTDAPCPFACASGLCIPLTWKCDREDDCNDGKNGSASSDEAECDYGCTTDQFRCNNMDCIPMLWRCDGHKDCIDESDETSECQTRECGTGFFKCESTGRCIPNLWVCDGENDCGDASDEHPSSGCNVTSCKPTEFQCKNFQCITGSFYCDRDDDCGDMSDEPPTCVAAKCTSEQFSCGNHRCISSNWTCNNIDDCGDGTDENEMTCPNKTRHTSSPTINRCGSDELFECDNKACVNVTKLCDGTNDCGDYSDESRCNVNECSSGFACAQACTDLPIGYKCSCFDGFEEYDSGHLCKDIDECHGEKPCSQYCRNTYGSYVCKCAEGYVEYNAAHSCLINSTIQPILIFSNRYFIRQVDLKGHDSQLRVRNLTNAVALDFDWEGKCIYWSDVNAFGSTIKRSCEVNPDTSKFPVDQNGPYEQVLHSATLQSPDGLAVDWIGRNVYWCDKGKDSIEVSKLDGTFRKLLIKEGLEEPRAIVVDPFQGYLYWSDWGEHAYIGKAAMDGSEPMKLITESLGWPNALAIDYVTKELFWADAREDYIACSDLNGKNRWMIASRKSNQHVPNETPIISSLHHIFAIAVFEDYIYWSDWESKRIEKCHKYKCKNSTKILQVSHRPMDLQIYHPSKQPSLNHSNPCATANCSTLCLLKPGPDGKPVASCSCPDYYVLDSDGRSCVDNCTGSQFVCKNTYKCIPFWWKCDTQDDCGDRYDEPSDCRPFLCSPGVLQCDNQKCVPPSQICDGFSQCGDGSDEKNCEKHVCLPSQFKCPTNGSKMAHCISGTGRCDGMPECPGGEDEMNCRKFPMNHIHPSSNPDSTGAGKNNTISDMSSDKRGGLVRRLMAITITIIVIAMLIAVIAFVHGFLDKVRKRRGFFSHRRMDENAIANVEISNPMFGDDDLDVSEVTDSTFSIEVDEKSTNFTNPLYEFQNHADEEKRTLLLDEEVNGAASSSSSSMISGDFANKKSHPLA